MPEDKTFINAKVAAQSIINLAPAVTSELVRTAVEEICRLPSYRAVSAKELMDALEKDNNILYGNSDSILDSKTHKPWLYPYPSQRPVDPSRTIVWKFWDDYRMSLLFRGWPQKVLENLDEMTHKVLMRLEDPKRTGGWIRHGLVVGDVQSGKTANYTGLISKAADAGYKLLVVFAGMYNNLRSQTQQRLDSDFIGFDSDRDDRNRKAANRIGVGRIHDHPVVHYVTTSNEQGDFSRAHASRTGLNPAGNNPVVLVVKKNVSIIRNLTDWAVRMGRREGHERIPGIPLLVIDDECDNASINTSEIVRDAAGNIVIDEYDPTAINRGIRKFLKLFDQCAYVGYTATPFASILIDRGDVDHPEYGSDLFPRDFIINLPEASNYIGPKEVFGLDGDPDLGIESAAGHPLYRVVDDYAKFIPDRHKKTLNVSDLPESLKESLKAFILSSAARRLRGQVNAHNSMLIHVTRFVGVQCQVHELVQEEVRRLGRGIRYEDKAMWAELKKLWEEDFTDRTSIPMAAKGLGQSHEWSAVKTEVREFFDRCQVKKINGKSTDVLDYKRYEGTGINLIAIGGDKLSRGLTLEGLTVSYYLRSSKMYDTLMQMGRWFGYRDGYLDLCRIYTTSELITWYRHIALASIELRREFDYMVENEETPENYGLKIRAHPGVLLVTALNKMRAGTTMSVTFDGYMAQTLFVHNDAATVRRNYEAVAGLLSRHKPARISIGYRISHVPPADVIRFLSEYTTHTKNVTHKPRYLIDYIRKLNKDGELVDWTVVIPSPADSKLRIFGMNGLDGGLSLTRRTAFELGPDYVQFEKALLSPGHEKVDLTPEERKRLAERILERGQKTEPPKYIRECRSPERGLLLLYAVSGQTQEGLRPPVEYGNGQCPVFGYAMSFPRSRRQREIAYVVDSLYPEELKDDADI